MDDFLRFTEIVREIDRLEGEGRFGEAARQMLQIVPEFATEGAMRSDVNDQLAFCDMVIETMRDRDDISSQRTLRAFVMRAVSLCREMHDLRRAVAYCELPAMWGAPPTLRSTHEGFDLIFGLDTAEIYWAVGQTEKARDCLRRCRQVVDSWKTPYPAEARPWISKLTELEHQMSRDAGEPQDDEL